MLVSIQVPEHLRDECETCFRWLLAESEPFGLWENGLAPGVRSMSPVQRLRRRYAPGLAESTNAE
jgi:hypothetical protein